MYSGHVGAVCMVAEVDRANMSNDMHPCPFSVECPIALHNMVNGGCMFIPFREEFVGGLGETSKVLPYDSPYICFWYLGGPSCDGRWRVNDSYVSCGDVINFK